MPIVTCPRCGLSQYAPASYTTRAECVVCQEPLRTPRAPERPRFLPFDRRIERETLDERALS
ncbi:MAG: hypothetical protein QOH72_1493 [Solirubrobacteraceae bacterium]|jgi:uncharacterized protein (DUF983 family)|nr:hypothetical protein [Solirubrobacteraceae bacterium]